jgi:hypothetical protein
VPPGTAVFAMPATSLHNTEKKVVCENIITFKNQDFDGNGVVPNIYYIYLLCLHLQLSAKKSNRAFSNFGLMGVLTPIIV